ncbi:hypothetical protein ACET6L_10510 [Aeromonas rivipollensis]
MSTLLLMLNPPELPEEGCGFVCLEPQSHAANAHQMVGHPGLRLLGRGDRMSLGMTLCLRPAP